MGLESLLQVDLKKLVEKIGKTCGVDLPESVTEAYLDGERDLLFLRFEEPEGVEVAEPLPTRTPAFLLTEEDTGKVTALEVVGARAAGRAEAPRRARPRRGSPAERRGGPTTAAAARFASGELKAARNPEARLYGARQTPP